MLHLAHKAALGDRPAFKSSDSVPTHDINLYLLDSPYCAWQERNFRNASSKAGDRADYIPCYVRDRVLRGFSPLR